MQEQIAELLRCLTQGVYIVGVGRENAVNAFTAAWVMQVSFKPTLLALSISPQHRSYALLKDSGAYSVNVLGAGQAELAQHFGQSGLADKLGAVPWHKGSLGVPVLDAVPAWLECQVMQELPAGDHVLVVGRVVAGEVRVQKPQLLTYAETGTMDESVQLYPDEL